MTFIAASERTFPLIEEFLAPYEYKCVTLASHIRKKDEHIFIISQSDFVQTANDIAGVFYFNKTLLHCIPLLFNKETETASENFEPVENSFKKSLAEKLLTFFEGKNIRCINGDSAATDFFLSVLKTKDIEPYQTNHYKLMTLTDEPICPPEPLSCDDEIRRCYDSDFDSLFDLQKKYIVKEVAPSGKQVSDLECSASLRQILKNQLCFALCSDDEIVAKANTNAIGIRWVQIGGVYTHPLFRKNYYAWNLVYAICCRIKKTERNVCLFVKDKNNPALQLYRRIGFEENCDFEICYF